MKINKIRVDVEFTGEDIAAWALSLNNVVDIVLTNPAILQLLQKTMKMAKENK
jgi:hypothetical protein